MNYERGHDPGDIERPNCYTNSQIPQEILMYEYMKDIVELSPHIPEYYTSFVKPTTIDFDKHWLLDPTK